MKNKYSISDVKVGWTVQLNSVAWDVPRSQFQGMWGKVETIHGTTLTVLLDGDMRVHFPAVDNFILNAVPPEPVKDPFAVGKWVVCVASHWPARTGDVLQVECESRSKEMFIASSWRLHKSYFRPANSEEIAVHLAKKSPPPKPSLTITTVSGGSGGPAISKICGTILSGGGGSGSAGATQSRAETECTLGETHTSASVGCEAKDKITFTVAGRQFFAGQRAYSTEAFKMFAVGDEVELLGTLAKHNQNLLICRKVGTSHILWTDIAGITLSPPPVHEWKFGDQASHPKHGNVLVIDTTEPTDFLCASPSDPEIFIDPAELTFICRIDLGE